MHNSVRVVAVITAIGLLPVSSACTAARVGSTPIMKSGSTADVSPLELRHRLDDAVPRFIGVVEAAADRIRKESPDPLVRRRALEWKVEAVQTVQIAAFQTDLPLAALDLWLLTVQMDDAFAHGAAASWFGDQQPIARDTAAGLRSLVESYALRVAHDEGAFERTRAIIHDTAKRFPVDAHISTRMSIVTIIDTLEGQTAVGSIDSVRNVADSVSEISNHLSSYMSTLPKLARWQAELMADEMADSYDLREALREIREAAAKAGTADLLAPDAIDRVLHELGRTIQAERIAMMREVDQQRIDSLASISQERMALLSAVARERETTIEALRRERIETIKSVEHLQSVLVDDASVRAVSLVDHLALRLVQIFATTGLMALVVTLVLRRVGPTSTIDK